MKLFVPILLGLLVPYELPNKTSPLVVVGFKWSRARRAIDTQEAERTLRAPQARQMVARASAKRAAPGLFGKERRAL